MRLIKTFALSTLLALGLSNAASTMIFYEKAPREGRFWRNADMHTSLNVGYRNDRFKTNMIPNGHDLHFRNRVDLIETKLKFLVDVTADQLKFMFVDAEIGYGHIADQKRDFYGTTNTAVRFNTTGKKSNISERFRAGTVDWQAKAGFDVAKFFNGENENFGLKPYGGYMWKKAKWGGITVNGATQNNASTLSMKTQMESRFHGWIVGALVESKIGNHKINLNADAILFGKHTGDAKSFGTPANPQSATQIKVHQRRRAFGYQFRGAYDYQFDHNWGVRLEGNHAIFHAKKKPRRPYEKPIVVRKADYRTSSIFGGLTFIW